MVRGLILAGAFVIGGGALCPADGPSAPKPHPRPGDPTTAVSSLPPQAGLNARPIPVRETPVNPDDSADVLEAQLDTRRAYSRAAEVGLVAAKKKLERVERARAAGAAPAEDVDQAKVEVDAAAAPTVAAFNMAAVMRDFEKAKYQVYLLNQKRLAESFDLIKWRSEYAQLQGQTAGTVDPKAKEDLGRRMVELSRKIEDKDREINKMLNDDAGAIISQLYDEIKAVVDQLAEANQYQIVFAYPDAVTAEEKANPQLKELKLNPPAAHPFFVAKPVDITSAVLRKLNTSYPPHDERVQKVDVSKLPLPTPSAAPTVPRQ